jgi:hypothetical protein
MPTPTPTPTMPPLFGDLCFISVTTRSELDHLEVVKDLKKIAASALFFVSSFDQFFS